MTVVGTDMKSVADTCGDVSAVSVEMCVPHLTPFHIASHCLTVSPSLPVTPCLEMIPDPKIAPSEPHRIYT